MKRIAIVLVVMVALVLPATSGALTASAPTPKQYVLAAHVTKCRAHYVKRTLKVEVREPVKRHGKWHTVTVVKHELGCEYIGPTTIGKPADPPTVVSVTSSENPAIVGDSVTFTVTVDHILSATTGKLELWDGTTRLTSCSVPATPTSPNGSAEISGTCTETYQGTGTFPISGIFTGDAVFAQAAGTLLETVAAPPTSTTPAGATTPPVGDSGAPTTTTTPPSTTTTTVPLVVHSQSTTTNNVRAINIGSNNIQLIATVSPEPSLSGQPSSADAGTVTFANAGGTLCVSSSGFSGDWSCVIQTPVPYPTDVTFTANFGGSTVNGPSPGVETDYQPSSGSGRLP